ncbi:MAG TPA: PAS domain-containing protein [Chitinophagales bacterium]|nr:PAS domain-containing protein [Chitinophagales bacterium]
MLSLDTYLAAANSYYNFIKEGVLLCDEQNVVHYANCAAEELLGVANADLMGTHLAHWCGDSFIEKVNAQKPALRNGTPVAFTHNEKTIYKTRVICTPLSDGESLFGAMYLIKNKKLPHRSTSDAFLERNNALRAMNLVHDQVCSVSDLKNGGLVFINERVESMCGWLPSDFLNGGWAFLGAICHPDDLPRVQQTLAGMLARYADPAYNEPFHMRYRLRHRNGRWIELEENACILERDTDGSPLYLIAFVKPLAASDAARKPVALSEREAKVAQCIVQGLSSKATSETLGMSIHTVNAIRERLRKKTNSPNTAALVKTLSDYA